MPGTVTADGETTTTLTVTAKDAEGNPIAGATVTLTSADTGDHFGTVSGTTNAAGVFTTTLSSTQANAADTVTALINGTASETATVDFTVGGVSQTTSSLAASPSTVTADGETTTTLTVTAKDAEGNPIVGATVALTSADTGDHFGTVSGTTNAAGVFTTTLSSTQANAADTVTALINGTASETATVDFTVAGVSQTTSSLAASPSTVTADGTSTTTLTVTAKDANGNLIPFATVTLTSADTGDHFGTVSGTTNAAGVFTTTLSSTQANASDTVTALINGTASETASVDFTAGAVSQTTSSLAASPSTVTADGTSTTLLTVTAEDANGNVIPDATVTLTSADTGDHFGTVSGTTNAAGVFTTTLSSTQANAADTVTALINGTASETATVDFTVGGVSQTTSSLTASPSTVAADGTSTTLLTVTAEDANGNLIPDATVTLTASGTGNTFTTPITGTTNAEGVFTTTLSSTVAQDDTFTALINGTASETATVDFTAALSVTSSVVDNLAVQEGQTLVATATIGDSAYSGATISYQWQSSSDGGATWTDVPATTTGVYSGGTLASFYQLGEADEGNLFRVQASFTNSSGQLVTVDSAPTTAVTDVTPVITPAFSYTVEDLSIDKVVSGTLTQIYDDTFTQAPPSSPPVSANGTTTPEEFLTLGSTWTTNTNGAVMSSTGLAANSVIAGNFDDIAILNTNTDPTSTSGLKEGGTWSVSANFSLTPDPYGNYGMELNDGSSSNTPNEDVRLIVVAGAGGSTIVELTDSDPTAGTQTVIAQQTLTSAQLASDNQIEFTLSHSAGSTAITGSFQLLDNGTLDTTNPNSSVTFANTGTMFTEGETFARVDVGAFVSSGVGLNVGANEPVQVGQTLTASATTNDPDATINYQWEESSSSSFSSFIDIGSNSSSYTLQNTDLGDYIRVVATTSDPDNTQTATATSAVTGAVLDVPPTVTVPVITGTAQEGQTLTAAAMAGGDDTLSYQWLENSGPNGNYQVISGATGPIYAVQESDEGYQIEVIATATNANGVTASQTSAPTSAVIDDATLSVAVSTTDNSFGVQEGQTLVAVATITGDATDLAAPVTYQWQSSSDGGQTWTDVGGAISGNYFNGIASFQQLTEADEGQQFRVQASFTDDTGQNSKRNEHADHHGGRRHAGDHGAVQLRGGRPLARQEWHRVLQRYVQRSATGFAAAAHLIDADRLFHQRQHVVGIRRQGNSVLDRGGADQHRHR